MKKQTTYQKESLTTKQSYLFLIIASIIGVFLMSSCSRSMSVERAAQGKARCGMYLR